MLRNRPIQLNICKKTEPGFTSRQYIYPIKYDVKGSVETTYDTIRENLIYVYSYLITLDYESNFVHFYHESETLLKELDDLLFFKGIEKIGIYVKRLIHGNEEFHKYLIKDTNDFYNFLNLLRIKFKKYPNLNPKLENHLLDLYHKTISKSLKTANIYGKY